MKIDIEELAHKLKPVEPCDGVLFRILGSGCGFIEFKGDFFFKVQEQIQQRLTVLASGVDSATELDKFILYIFESAMITPYRSTEGSAESAPQS
jgi:hypothetical protein